MAVAAGVYHSLGLNSDGSIVAWGRNDIGQTDVPSPNTDFVAVAGGYNHSLGLKSDGSIVAWGNNEFGQTNVPSPNADFGMFPVDPSSGSWTGGYQVVISGSNLGNGTDITNVTLCGVSATISSQTVGRVWIVAGASVFTAVGDVRVYSTSVGETVNSNSFEYLREAQAALSFTPTSPQTYNTTNTLSVSGGSGTGTVSYAVTAGPGVITNGTSLVVTAGTGTVTVVATKAADDLYFATSTTSTVTAAKAAQAITFANPGAQLTTEATPVMATASSGLPVMLEVISGAATLSTNVSPATLTYSGAGQVSVVASQSGDDNWLAAAPVTNTFTVSSSAPTLVAVHRFWSVSLQSHFFTASEAERDSLAKVWAYEGIAFYAHAQAIEGPKAVRVTQRVAVDGTKPVHRLWSDKFQGHLYTISESQKAAAVARGFQYEGYAWHAFTNQASGTLPVYRFVARKSKKLFFTISEAEKVSLISNSSAYWSYKGIAWYAYPTAQNVQPAMNALQDSEDPLDVLDASVVDQSGAVASEVAFSLSYGSDKVVEATLHDPQKKGFIQVLEPTVSPRELVIPYLPFGQRYWLSVMSRDVGAESSTLDYGGWLGRVAELPRDEIATVGVSAGMPIGLPVEMITLPENAGPLSLLLYEPTSDRLIQAVTGLAGGSTYELTVPAWNQWYLLEIEDATSGALLESLWIGHMRTH